MQILELSTINSQKVLKINNIFTCYEKGYSFSQPPYFQCIDHLPLLWNGNCNFVYMRRVDEERRIFGKKY